MAEMQKKLIEKSSRNLLKNGLCVLFSAICIAFFDGIEIMPLRLMILAFVFGAVYLLTVFFLLCAFDTGSMGASTILCNIGVFISAIYGVLRFNDDFSFGILLGMMCMLLAVILAGKDNKKDKKKNNGKWFMLALLSGLSNGVVASIKREAVAIPGCDAGVFLFWGFLFAAVIVFAIFILKVDNVQSVCAIKAKPHILLYGILAGVGTSVANLFQMRALETGLSSAIVYPVTAGFLVVSLWLVSLLVYKEIKFRLSNFLATVFCVCAIILVRL